jgi:hypothetical protein
VKHVVLRLAAGYTLDEIAAVLERDRPELRHLRLPAHVSKESVAARMRELRREIRASASGTPRA